MGGRLLFYTPVAAENAASDPKDKGNDEPPWPGKIWCENTDQQDDESDKPKNADPGLFPAVRYCGLWCWGLWC